MALLLALARRIPQADASMKQGRWEKKKLEGMELRGKTLGLIGLGQIGSDVARLAKAFEMQIIAYDPYVSSLLAGELDVKLVSLEEVLKSADFISLHASATPETRHLINARTLALAQPGVRIVNCARGDLINEADLLAALESGLVAGAGLDVFETEPPKDSKLVSHPNVIATPHIAGSTEEAQEIVGIRIAEQVRDFLLSGVARNAVNMPAVSPEEFKKLEPYIQLGEKLGAFLAQIAGERIREVRISYDGGLAELNTHLVKNAVLKGILTPALSDQVNLINAGRPGAEARRGSGGAAQRAARDVLQLAGHRDLHRGRIRHRRGHGGRAGHAAHPGTQRHRYRSAPARHHHLYSQSGCAGRHRQGGHHSRRSQNQHRHLHPGTQPANPAGHRPGQCRQSRAGRGAAGNSRHSRRAHGAGGGGLNARVVARSILAMT